jgi:hypothetical protein
LQLWARFAMTEERTQLGFQMKRYSILLPFATAVALLTGCAYDEGYYRDRTNARGAYPEPREYRTEEYAERQNYVEPVRDDRYTDEWIASCEQRYRSFDPASGTYLGYDGYRHDCR